MIYKQQKQFKLTNMQPEMQCPSATRVLKDQVAWQRRLGNLNTMHSISERQFELFIFTGNNYATEKMNLCIVQNVASIQILNGQYNS